MLSKIHHQPVRMGRATNKSMGVGSNPLWLRIIKILKMSLKDCFNLLPYRNPKSEINKLIRSRWRLVHMFNPIVYERMNLKDAERIHFVKNWEKAMLGGEKPRKLMFFIMAPWFLISDILRHKKNIDEYIFKVSLNCFDDSDLAMYVNQRALFYGKTFGLILGVIISWMLIKLLPF